MRNLILMLLFVCFYTTENASAVDNTLPPITVLSVSQPSVMYDTGRDGCNQYDAPDEPARAFRDNSGLIHFFFTNSTVRAMIGRDFAHLKHACGIAFKGALDTDPSSYNDNGWLVAFYASGNNVFALIHNEFHGSERPDMCPPNGGANCVEVAVTAAVSTDGGYHFTRYPGDKGLVAALPYTFRAKRGTFFGYPNPSNIIKRGDYYYVLVSAINPYDRSRNGVCVLRTPTLSDSSSWQAWNGQDFLNNIFVNPYHTKVADPIAHTCTPLPNKFFTLGSVLWSQKRKSYLLVTRVQKWDINAGRPAGAYLFESSDLIHWSGPTLLLSDAEAGGEQRYPSLIDPNSPDPNFTTIGNSANLYTQIIVPGEKGYYGWKGLVRHITFGGL